MIRNLEITVKVNVHDVPEEMYAELIDKLQNRMKHSIGIEDWELSLLLDPHKIQNTGGPHKTYFPVSIEEPDLTEEFPEYSTKIKIIR